MWPQCNYLEGFNYEEPSSGVVNPLSHGRHLNEQHFFVHFLHDCSLSVYSKPMQSIQNYFHSSETCVANAAVSKLTLPGVPLFPSFPPPPPPPPPSPPPLPSSPSSPFVNISKYAAKHSTWAQPGASLDIATWLQNSYFLFLSQFLSHTSPITIPISSYSSHNSYLTQAQSQFLFLSLHYFYSFKILI